MNPSKRTFYRTVFQVVVLSEEPLSKMSLEDLGYEIYDGSCSGAFTKQDSIEVDGATMAALLIDQGSDPSFFQLTGDGEDTEEDEA